MNAFRRDRWSASSGGTHSLLGGQFAVYLRLISPYLSPVYRAASISYQRHINFMLTAARINTLFTSRPAAGGSCLRPARRRGGAGTQSLPCRAGEVALRSRRRRGVGVCASYQRSADFRHPSGRTFVRPPPLQVGEAFTSRRTRPAGREPCGSSAYKFPPAHRRAGRRQAHPNAVWRSLALQMGRMWYNKGKKLT